MTDDALDRIPIVGVPRRRVVAVLAQLPTDVIAHLAERPVILAVFSRAVRGFHAVDVEGLTGLTRAPSLIVVGDVFDEADFASCLVHEVAHSWVRRDDPPVDLSFTTPAAIEMLVDASAAVAADDGTLGRWLADVVEAERRVCEQVRAWGFDGIGADVQRCTAGAARALNRLAARAHAEHFPPRPDDAA
jgi:hypothetical protein